MNNTHKIEEEVWGFDTIAIHADKDVEKCPDVAPPIHVTTMYKHENEVTRSIICDDDLLRFPCYNRTD